MEITVHVDEKMLEGVVNLAVSNAFVNETWRGNDAGVGLRAIERQVKVWVTNQDFSHIIAAVAEEVVTSVVRDVVADFVRKEIGAELRRMKKEGAVNDLLTALKDK